MCDHDYILTFLKFGEEVHIQDLLKNGTIFMKSIQEFKKIEDNQLRGDKYEGVSEIWNLPAGEFEIKAIGYKGKYISLHLYESYEKTIGNIYSMYCISSRGFKTPQSVKIDKRVKEFGSHFLMIKNSIEFRSRILKGLEATGFKYYSGFVDYYNKDAINDKINIFQKPDDFEFQKEYRFYIERDDETPYSFQIGSLEDIAEVFPVDKIDEDPLIVTT